MQSASDQRDATAARVVDGLRRLVHGMRAASYSTEQSVGVSGAQLFVLRELAAEPGASIRRLSERTLTDASSVSVVVARLVERGLVTRRRAPDDARRSVLSVARRGLSLLARAPEPYQRRLIEALKQLPASELHRIERSLARIGATLELTAGPAPLFFEDQPRRRGRQKNNERKITKRKARAK